MQRTPRPEREQSQQPSTEPTESRTDGSRQTATDADTETVLSPQSTLRQTAGARTSETSPAANFAVTQLKRALRKITQGKHEGAKQHIRVAIEALSNGE